MGSGVDDLTVGTLLGLVGFVTFGSVVPVLPTGAAVSAAAVLARDLHPWEVVVVIAAGGLGAYLGDLILYAILRTAGAPLAQRIGWLNADDPGGALQQIRVTLERNEVRSLVLSRLLPAGRVPVLLAAALGGYPIGRFVSANVLAALLWSTMYAAIGVVGNTLIPDTRVALAAVVVAALVVGLVLPRLRRRRAQDS